MFEQRRGGLAGPALSVLAVVTAGTALRMLASLRGYNYDLESYRIVADLVEAGKNVYAGTSRYNYGPPWFHILHFLDSLAGGKGIEVLHVKVAAFLTLVDVAIFILLLRRYSLFVAAIFFLNPISIIITGYHSQFDNLAILVALVSVMLYEKYDNRAGRLACLLGIGLSLSIKHILFMFPLWLAFREQSIKRKLLAVALPYGLFLVGFLFYVPEGLVGIGVNVFFYKSFDNAPFWTLYLPALVYSLTPKMPLFIGMLACTGLFLHRRPVLELLHIYLIAVVLFSSAITNQYLAIPAASIAVLWNWGYALYTVMSGLYLCIDHDALHVQALQALLGGNWRYGYHVLIFLLSLGFFVTVFGRERMVRVWQGISAWCRHFWNEVRAQVRTTAPAGPKSTREFD